MSSLRLIQLSVLYFVLMILLAHICAPAGYYWTDNTISDLGAQGLPMQWIMQAGFIGFGVLLNLGFIWKYMGEQKNILPDLPIMGYALCVLLTGFFSAAPYISGVKYSIPESHLHSQFATAAGFLFTFGILLRLILSQTVPERWLHASLLILVISASAGFGLAENNIIPLGQGIPQRALYLVSFVWLILSQR